MTNYGWDGPGSADGQVTYGGPHKRIAPAIHAGVRLKPSSQSGGGRQTLRLVRGAWKILVGIKDALVLAAMLLFFGLLFAGLAARPSPSKIKDGALVLNLNGQIVEQANEVDPLSSFGGAPAAREYRLREDDVVMVRVITG